MLVSGEPSAGWATRPEKSAANSEARPVTMAHVIVWGTIEIRVDDDAQQLWEAMITRAFGPAGLGQRSRKLSREGTMLGLLTPSHHRIYGLKPAA